MMDNNQILQIHDFHLLMFSHYEYIGVKNGFQQ
jgi:hypothetical protein